MPPEMMPRMPPPSTASAIRSPSVRPPGRLPVRRRSARAARTRPRAPVASTASVASAIPNPSC